MRFIVAITICLAGFVMQRCDEDDTLPPATSEGRGSFGCYVNSELWLIDGRNHQPGTFIVNENRSDTTMVFIYAENVKSDEGFTIYVYDIPDLVVGKRYDFSQQKFFVQFTRNLEPGFCDYTIPRSGYVEFSRIDFKNRVVAGEFQFELTSDSCSGEAIVTRGRFDISEIMS